MSDNLGSNQTRVLDTINRSFESVVYQKRKPPLSCEENLAYALTSDHVRLALKASMPSGWEVMGTIKGASTESQCLAGDVVTSPVYSANTLKLIALDKGVEIQRLAAWVNGYKVVVQGTNSLSDENNIIILPAPPTITYRVDFVFLEVWRKLLKTTDVMYKHGNVLYGGVNPTNDLIDPAAGFETSLRIQLQYRIRVAAIDLVSYPDGFDPNNVYARCGNANPLSCVLAAFLPVPGDPGLWRAGNGDSASQETLGSVDGYSYAIPMLAVSRRNTGAYDPDARSNGAGKTRADYLAGYASDRPDNLYSDWIVAEDILDMRHLISPSVNYKEEAEKAFWMLAKGEMRGRMEFSARGEDHIGAIMTQADAVSNVDTAGAVEIGVGDGLRRVFSNAAVTQPDTFKSFDATASWGAGDVRTVSVSTYPTGTLITGINGVWVNGATNLVYSTDYIRSSLPAQNVSISIVHGLSSSAPLVVDYTCQFPSGPNGLTRVPTTFLEARRQDSSASYALTSDGIRVRQAPALSTMDGTKYDMVYNMGWSRGTSWNFGHQMVHHIAGTGVQLITMPRTVYGYKILGIISCSVSGSPRVIGVSRDAVNYTIDLGSPVAAGADIALTLYTEGKIFAVNAQGRAITDCFEMKEIIASGSGTTYTVDATNQRILAIASTQAGSGYGFCYVGGTQTALLSNNSSLPTDNTSSRATIKFSLPPGGTVEVPVLVRSAIGALEGFDFFYRTVPYQGLLDSTAFGTVLGEGPALTTTAGSGTITGTNPPMNIVDRMPTKDSSNDGYFLSEAISTPVSDAYPSLETRIISRVQDVIDSSSILIGMGTASRGHTGVFIPGALYGAGTLGLKFEKLDASGYRQKTYQSYVVDPGTGQLRLMVVASESDNTSVHRFLDHTATTDTVDLFEMPGRPLTVNKGIK